MSEWDKIRMDSKGNSSTIMVRDRIQDVAFHVVHFQEAFLSMIGKIDDTIGQHATLIDTIQNVLNTHTDRLATIEKFCATRPTMHNISTPQHAVGPNEMQAVMEQPGTPAFAPAAQVDRALE